MGECSVSIPLRQAKNPGRFGDLVHPNQRVSIPLRQAKNRVCEDCKSTRSLVSIPLRQAKNLSDYHSRDYSPLFQFLLGRLKTYPRLHFFSRTFTVSIPLRQAKNEKLLKLAKLFIAVSIPLRQAKNLNPGLATLARVTSFNSS